MRSMGIISPEIVMSLPSITVVLLISKGFPDKSPSGGNSKYWNLRGFCLTYQFFSLLALLAQASLVLELLPLA